MSDSRLPHELRASFTRLMLHLHVVRGSPLNAIRHARLWRDIPETVSVEQFVVIYFTDFFPASFFCRSAILHCSVV